MQLDLFVGYLAECNCDPAVIARPFNPSDYKILFAEGNQMQGRLQRCEIRKLQ